MERTKSKTEDWARVRFGAGTPWRRCWCVITPPDEKEVQKLQKQMNKKKSAYDRSRPALLKGDIKFYDSKRTKKVNPIATITDAYSGFAIYPQAKPLIDASTLVKVEGSITIHSNPPSTTEGFVFVMPEVHPAVTGFEIMLRWLFPVFDTFALYGRPGRLIADTTNPLSLMFAMPKHRRYGYLEILDVSGLILEQGSSTWRESEWRRRMKDLTSKRMTAIENGSQGNSRYSSRRSARNSFGPSRTRIQFDDGASVRSSPSIGWQPGPPQPDASLGGIPRTDSAPPAHGGSPRKPVAQHNRSVSETQGIDRFASVTSNYDGSFDNAPTPPPHNVAVMPGREASGLRHMSDIGTTPERVSSEDETSRGPPVHELEDMRTTTSPEPVAAPPAFSHTPGSKPISKPYHSPELRRANSRMSNATLSQLAGAGGVSAAAYHAIRDRPGTETSEDQRRQNVGRYSEDRDQRGVLSDANNYGYPANRDVLNEGLVEASNPRFSFEGPSPSRTANSNTRTEHSHPPPQFPYASPNFRPASSDNPFPNRTYEPPQVFTSPDLNREPIQSLHQTLADPTPGNPAPPSRLQTNPTLNRKAFPGQSSSIQTPTSAHTSSSAGSLGQVFDEAAFGLIGTPVERKRNTLLPETNRIRTDSEATSVYEDIRYDDDESTASPDYASTTRPSIDTQKSVERPRAGVMKTVGNAAEARHGPGANVYSSDIPNIDFGPTMNLASDRAPRQRSPGPNQVYSANYSSKPTGRASPGPGFNFTSDLDTRPRSSGHSRSPSQPVFTPGGHYRTDSAESRRSVAWQPGMSSVGNNVQGKQQAITAEQFVQQRAAASTPSYPPHQRHSSGYTFRGNTPTPPLVRNRSSELLAQQGGHSRQTSADLLQRPSPRGASAALGPAGSGDMPTTLSAREQEHLARLTGQPLVSMAQNTSRPSTSSGLVGTIESREKEKQQMRQGINSQAVQNAITYRQQQAMQQQQQHPEYMNNYRAPQSQYSQMNQYPQGHYPQGQQQQWVSPAANVYAQGGGFSAPSPISPEFGQQQTPTQQYFNQQQRMPQQGGARGNFQGRQY